MKTDHTEIIRRLNRTFVLEQIRSEHRLSRASLAKKLGLSRSTVSSIVEELIAKKFVVELGYGESTSEGGRRGMELGFNSTSAYGIGVDVGGTGIIVLVTDLNGEIIYRESAETPKTIHKIIQFIKSAIKKSQIPDYKIISMCIGFPGAVNMNEGVIIESASLKLKNVSVGMLLEREFAFPTFILNDVNCAALGERWLGSGMKKDDLVFIAVRTGLGCAIISNGELVLGYSFTAGEIAYFIDSDDVKRGKKNTIGQFGTLEQRISAPALQRFGWSLEELLDKFTHKDNNAVKIIEDFILEASLAISNIVSLLNPEKVILGGEVSEVFGMIADKIGEKVKQYTPIHTTVELASLGENACALGAIYYAFQQIQDKL